MCYDHMIINDLIQQKLKQISYLEIVRSIWILKNSKMNME